MAIAKSSLYDWYKLSNSTAIPMYQGSTGPEAIQVASHLQGLYDTASQGAADISSASENLQSLPVDRNLANELRSTVNGKIDQYSKAGDWENHLPDVRSLARTYASRSAELFAPVQQYNEWQKELDNKDKNLTPLQKDSLKALALSNYTGLQKDPSGRYIGKFNGPEIAKNVDVNEKVDKWLKDIAIQKGGSEIANVDGMWKIKKGNTWETLAPGTIEQTLNYAMQNDRELQAHLQQEGDIAGFTGAHNIHDLNQLTPTAQTAVKQLMIKGYSSHQALNKVFSSAQQSKIVNDALNYGKIKYTYHKAVHTEDLSENSNYWQQNKEAAQNGIFGDVVTGGGIDLNRFGSPDDIETSRTTSTAEIERATNEVNAAKNVIASKLKVKPETLSDKQISDYYSTSDPTGLGKYKANLQSIESSKSALNEVDQLRNAAMDLATRKKNPGMTYDELKSKSTDDFQKAVKDDKLSFTLGNTKVNAGNINNYEVLDGDINFGDSGNYIKLKDKQTGKVFKVQTQGSSFGNNDSIGGEKFDAVIDNSKLRKIGGRFDGINWKSEWKEAATNIRSNSMWMPLLDKTTPDGQTTKAGAYSMRVKSVLAAGAGGLSIKDADFSNLDSDDSKDMKARINAGQFDVRGIGKVKGDGKMYVQLSVDTDTKEADPAKRYKTVVVGVESNVANKLSGYAMDAGTRDNDIRTYQFGRAMATNSGYEQVLNMGTTGRLQINNSKLLGSNPLFEVVPNITGSSSDAVSYEVYNLDTNGNRTGSAQTFNDAFDLGAFLDAHRDEGKTIVKKTK